MTHLGRILFILLSLFWAMSADAQKIRTDQLTVSTDLTEDPRFKLEQIKDGVTSDAAPHNGFQSRTTRGTVSFTLDKAYDVSAFLLWNDIAVRLEGVRTFRLDFYDDQGQVIYRHPETETGTIRRADGSPFGIDDVQRFTFPVVKNVKKIDLVVTSVFNVNGVTYRPWIEIREVEFEGRPSVTTPPEPDYSINHHCKPYNIKFFDDPNINPEYPGLMSVANFGYFGGKSVEEFYQAFRQIDHPQFNGYRDYLFNEVGISRGFAGANQNSFKKIILPVGTRGRVPLGSNKKVDFEIQDSPEIDRQFFIVGSLPARHLLFPAKCRKNTPPVATPNSYSLAAGESKIIQPVKDDTDQEKHVLELVSVTSKAGRLTARKINGSDIELTAGRQAGEVSIEYLIKDAEGAQTTGIITVNVTQDCNIQTVEDEIILDAKTSGMVSPLANDQGCESQLSLGATPKPQSGISFTETNGGYRVTTGNETGQFNFKYTAQDAQGRAEEGVIYVTVTNEIVDDEPVCDITAPTLSATIASNSSKTLNPLDGLSCPGQTLTLGPTPNGKSGVYFSKSANGYEISTGGDTGRFSFPYTIGIGPISKSGTINVTVKESVECLRTSRLRGYLPMIDRMSSGLPSELNRLETLYENLPDDNFTAISVPDYCPVEIQNRARDLQSRLDALISGDVNRESLVTTQEKAGELIETIRQHLADIEDARNNMAACVDPDIYKSWDEKLGALMENASALEQAADALRSDLAYYQASNLDSRGLDRIYQDKARLDADIKSQCKLPLVIVENSYDFKLGESKIIDPLADDYDPNIPEGQRQRLKIITFNPAPGALASGANYLQQPPFTVTKLDDHSFRVTAGQQEGDFEFTYEIENPYGDNIPSSVGLSLKKPDEEDDEPVPWWVWPLGGGLLVTGGLLGFLLKGRSASAAVEAASTSTRVGVKASDSLRRLLRADLKFRKDEGVPFGKSPLIAAAIEPGPEPKLPLGHEVPTGLATLTGPFFVIREAYRATGRIGYAQEGVPTNEDVSLGTGFIISPNLIMTNQHVYEAYKHYLEGDECGGIEFIAERDRDASDYYEFDGKPPIVLPDLDIAIFRTKKRIIGRKPLNRVYVPTDDLLERDVIVVGYPCPFELDDYILSLVEPDPIFGIKRVTQGQVFRHSSDKDGPFGILFKVDALINGKEQMSAVCHNATTLAGNSGSPVICAKTGKLLGVHFAGSRSLFGGEAANLAMAIESILEKEEEEEF